MPKILLAQLTGGIAKNGTDTRELTFRVSCDYTTRTESHTAIIKPRFYGRMGLDGHGNFGVAVGTEHAVYYKVTEEVGAHIIMLLSGEKTKPLYGEDTILRFDERSMVG